MSESVEKNIKMFCCTHGYQITLKFFLVLSRTLEVTKKPYLHFLVCKFFGAGTMYLCSTKNNKAQWGFMLMGPSYKLLKYIY